VQWLKLFCYKKKKDKDYFISLTHFSVYRTNIYVNPPVAPPLIGGYGYGCGGWGLSPFSFFAPAGPAVAVGVGGGFDPSFSSCFLEPLQP
ncbi:BnaAnng41620D, partial [Brassica napus]